MSRTIEGNAYSCDLSVIGKSGVAGVDETGAAATYDILAGDETTASLKTKVNIFQTSDGTYHLINMVAASDPALGLQNTAGVKGSIVDNVMKLSFAQRVKTTKIAKIEEVVNALPDYAIRLKSVLSMVPLPRLRPTIILSLVLSSNKRGTEFYLINKKGQIKMKKILSTVAFLSLALNMSAQVEVCTFDPAAIGITEKKTPLDGGKGTG